MNVNVLSDEGGVVTGGKKRNNDDGPGVVGVEWVYLCYDMLRCEVFPKRMGILAMTLCLWLGLTLLFSELGFTQHCI